MHLLGHQTPQLPRSLALPRAPVLPLRPMPEEALIPAEARLSPVRDEHGSRATPMPRLQTRTTQKYSHQPQARVQLTLVLGRMLGLARLT